jgi:hypothetical protein
LESYFERNKKLAHGIKSVDAVRRWEKIVEEYVGAHTRATTFKDRVLFVNTDSSALANELTLREKELLNAINKALGSPLVKKIVFKAGFLGKKNTQKELIDKTDKKLSIRTMHKIDRMVNDIKEEELRSVLRRLLVASAKRNPEL